MNLREKMQEVVDEVVTHYKKDFEYDLIALEGVTEFPKEFLWIPRECGTYLIDFKETYHRYSPQYYTQQHFGPSDGAKCYYVVLKGNEDGVLDGTMQELDYAKHQHHVAKMSVTPEVRFTDVNGRTSYYDFDEYLEDQYYINKQHASERKEYLYPEEFSFLETRKQLKTLYAA